MKRIKIGQIGIGHNHGSEKMASLRRLSDVFEVVGVVESDPEWMKKRGNLAPYQGLPFMTEEELFATPGLEAVAVETDVFELCPTALRCAEKGFHIHMDKPGGEDLHAFGRVLDMCRRKNLVFQQAYIYRYNPAVRFCLEAVRKGWLGEIFEIHAVMSRYDGDNAAYRQWLSQFKGGAMYIFAGYLIDLVIAMLGAPDKVTPFIKKTRDDALIDNGLAVLEYAKATATVRVSVEEVEGYKHRRLIVCGTEGSVEICPIEFQHYYTDKLSARLTLKHPKGAYEAGTHTVDCGLLNCRYGSQLTEFAKIIRKEMANPWSFDHEYLLHKTLLEACNVKIEE